MFDRFIRLARAKKALKEQRHLDALQQASDPIIADDQRAERVRLEAVEQLAKRARARLDAGDGETALREARRLRQLAAGDVVEQLLLDVEQAVAAQQRTQAEDQQARGEFRKLVDAGELAAAESLLAGLPQQAPERQEMADLISERRRQAAEALQGAASDADQGQIDGAIEGYLQALRMDSHVPEAARAATMRQVASAAAGSLQAPIALGEASPSEFGAILGGYARLCAKLPALADEASFAALHQQMGGAMSRCLDQVGSLADAGELARQVQASGVPIPSGLDGVVAALLAMLEGGAPEPQARAAVLVQLQEDARRADLDALAALAAEAVTAAASGEEQLHAARALLEEGNLEAARALFVAFLNDNPLHAGVQKELDLVDQGLADLDRRLADLRMTLRAGRLREACSNAIALVGSSRIAEEVKQILAEARSRIALVDKGVDEIRVSLHGRAAATLEGVRHCLKRLEELAKVQVDHVELPQLIAAVSVEIEALELCEKAKDALSREDLEVVVPAVSKLVAFRDELIGVERMDAKLCHLGDAIGQFGDRALAAGRLAQMLRCGGVLEQLEVVRADFGQRARDWRKDHQDREVAVGELLREARSRLVDRDLAEAERLVEEAQSRWRESAEVQAFAHQLRKLRKQTHTLEEVAAMAEDKDFLGAHQKLSSMPSVPAMLRTRVYDIKQDLARAQGLEGSFLLRVDEGGEQLVMRGESVSIGNVQKASADLPILANLAGRHATIQRSMSFHGGMQDSIVAEDGEVKIDGEVVKKQALKSGDKIALGPALGVLYQRPTSRSLSSRLLLQNGFQVAGTDRVLMMKDRGRDGRILIGPSQDVHVTVAKGTGEVELFANNAGQMRVFCEQGGSIDGTVFKGEHPVAAGQVIEACGITFLLLPWQPMT